MANVNPQPKDIHEYCWEAGQHNLVTAMEIFKWLFARHHGFNINTSLYIIDQGWEYYAIVNGTPVKSDLEHHVYKDCHVYLVYIKQLDILVVRMPEPKSDTPTSGWSANTFAAISPPEEE